MTESTIIFLSMSLLIIFLLWIYFRLESHTATQKIKFLIEEEKIDEAISFLEALIQKKYNVFYRFQLAKLYYKKKNWALAIPMFEDIVYQSGNQNSEIYRQSLYHLGYCFYHTGDINQAEDKARILIKTAPNFAHYQVLMGDIFFAKKKFPAALEAYHKAAQIQNDLERAWDQVGLIFFQDQEFKKALDAYIQALHITPNSTKLLFMAGQCSEKLGLFDEAFSYYQNCTRVPNVSTEIYQSCLTQMGLLTIETAPKDSISYFSQVISILFRNKARVDKECLIRYYLAMSYINNDQINLAIREWKKILEINPSYKDVTRKLTQYQELQNNEFIKDILTHSDRELLAIIENFITSLGFIVRGTQSFSYSVDVTTEDLLSMWKRLHHKKVVFSFWCADYAFPLDVAQRVAQQYPSSEYGKVCLISGGPIMSEVRDFLKRTGINFYTKENLQEVSHEFQKK